MATELTPQQAFQERLKDRIRNDIGELMPDEVLEQMVAAVIQDAFFKETEIKDRWGEVKERHKPPIYDEIASLAKPVVEAAAKQWITANHAVVERMVQQLIDEGIAKAMMAGMRSLFQTELFNFQAQLENKLHNILN